ncbi:MAG: hypothetical protein H6740_07635 [Alphaproteobacteria bacterium]|nr:hypothetical protein [Alphaproteobacteria bacterium]
MNDSGIFMGWERPAPGEGAKAMELYKRMDGYLRTLHAEGRIDWFEFVILGPNGTDLGGFVLIRGAREKLDVLRSAPEFREITVRGNVSLLGFRVVRAHMGGEVRQILGAYQRVAAETLDPSPRWS